MINKTRFNLRDSSFAHEKCSVAGLESQFISWQREPFDPNLSTFSTHEYCLNSTTDPKRSYGWMIESPEFINSTYRELRRHIKKFKKIFTYDDFLLENYPDSCYHIPGGGIWISGDKSPGEIKIYDKTKRCSLVVGLKMMCEMHSQRVKIAELLHTKIDVMGDLVGKYVPIIDSLKDYMFTIVIENHRSKNYFTEKILNAFSCGVVPIYFGCYDIGRFFDTNGIIQVSSIDEIMSVIHKLNENQYYDRMEAIKKNFELCKKYKVIEDFIYENYLKDEVHD